jgi:ribose/xylose/arabinose/galactoside ABC-type transport system permease subunit
LALVTWFILHWTVFGRHVFALGSSEATARLCGIDVSGAKLCVYALGGVFIGLAGLFSFAQLSEGEPTGGSGMELKIIAAVVIGGGSLNGGRGSVVGTLTGAAIMPIILAGCTKLGLANAIQDIALGVIIIAAVALDRWRQGRSGDS